VSLSLTISPGESKMSVLASVLGEGPTHPKTGSVLVLHKLGVPNPKESGRRDIDEHVLSMGSSMGLYE
jgi:hypothetical protein